MAGHEFKVGDQVAHKEHGNGEFFSYGVGHGIAKCVFSKYPEGGTIPVFLADMRPRNFLSKIEEDQESKTVDQQFNEVFKPERFQRNAYGQLVDTVTGLPADSEGIVTITSIRDSVREIS